jgi:hypothetical protein
MRKLSPMIAAVTGAAIPTLARYAQAFSVHGGHHHGSPEHYAGRRLWLEFE